MHGNQVYTLNGSLQGNFQQVAGTPPNQAMFQYYGEIYKNIAIAVGLDMRHIVNDAKRTAYETAVQRESELERVNVVLKNRDKAYGRFADLFMSDIQMFYSREKIKQIIEIPKNGSEDKIIENAGKMTEPHKIKVK